MLCENCGKNQANIKYTEVINGAKKQMHLCEKCSKDFGIGEINFNLPIDFSSFFGDFLENYDNNFLPSFNTVKKTKCEKCGMTYEEFISTGKFGCENCYNVFTDKVDPILKNLHGANIHHGKKQLPPVEKVKPIIKKEKQVKSKLDDLKDQLKKAIKEERYEDAAKIRDSIKNLEKKEE